MNEYRGIAWATLRKAYLARQKGKGWRSIATELKIESWTLLRDAMIDAYGIDPGNPSHYK